MYMMCFTYNQLFGHIGRAWAYLHIYCYGHFVREVAGSRLDRGITIGGVFHPTRKLARFSPPNMPFILNLFRISLRDEEAVNYRPLASPSFGVFSRYIYV